MERPLPDRGVQYDCLVFVCPGCIAGGPEGYDGVHLLPVNALGIEPSWKWDGNIHAPTLEPSILTEGHSRCHSFLRNGVFEFLDDSDHPLAGQKVEMLDLPDWVADL